jgi:hypothetical protein
MLLLGFDYNGEVGHCDLRAYIETRSQDMARWHHWAKNFKTMKRDLDVQGGALIVNACETSRISVFPKLDIERALVAVKQGHLGGPHEIQDHLRRLRA